MGRDEVFREKLSEIKRFEFSEAVASVFDDMIARSVPRYEEVTEATCRLAAKLCRRGDTVLDLGCSTGNALFAIGGRISGLQLVGIDNSAPMLHQAAQKGEALGISAEFLNGDLLEIPFPRNSLTIINYTLQFIPIDGREELLRKVFAALEPGGALILTEKLAHEHPRISAHLTDLYYDFKRDNHYSELEISQKREALENVLVPLTLEENLRLLRSAGFQEVELYLKWINFGTFIALR